MQSKRDKLTSWGLFPVRKSTVSFPKDMESVRSLIMATQPLIARGNGRSYGDAALGDQVVSTLKWNQITAFDTETGLITCQSGVLFSDILDLIVPKGWFFIVTPGTSQITVGGAIACDIHGKNHPQAGCFSQHLISFDLLLANGETVTCSKTQHASLFWQTCGGMGWTGVILKATFQLKRIQTTYMNQTTIRFEASKIDEILDALKTQYVDDYAAGWLDLSTSKLKALLFFNQHELTDSGAIPTYQSKKSNISVPFQLPFSLINKYSIKAYNAYYFLKNRAGKQKIDLSSCFYPLDSIQHWNRLYGRRGFIQYQFCIPESSSSAGMDAVITAIQNSPETPFLAVLKRHGERLELAVHSFPIKGFSLALDFPRTPTVALLIQQLDEIVWQFEGKIYLAKDAASAKHMSRVNPNTFGDPKFSSDLKQRIL